jgi:hypothetical protein
MHPRMQELLDFMDGQYAAFRAAVDAVPAGDRERQPADEAWSVAQVVDHVSKVERMAAHLVERELSAARERGLGAETETGSVVRPDHLDRLTNRTVRFRTPEAATPAADARFAEASAALEAAHQRVRQVFADADGLALETAHAPHPRLGQLTLYEWGVAVGGHEARHTEQIREIAAALQSAAID